MRKWALVGVAGLWLACGAGCSTGAGEGDPTQSEVDGVTEGGCECPSDPAERGRLSLDCFCAEFGGCPSYEEIMQVASQGDGDVWHRCFDDSRWWAMEQRGCGKIIVTTGPDLGGWAYVYDERTLELTGALLFSDVSFASCGTSVYTAGESASCDEGDICSLCEEGACAPVCSIEAMKNTWGAPSYEDEAVIDYACADPALGAELRVGCGKARIVNMWGVHTYSADTHELLAVENDSPECGGVWGDPGEPCAEDTVCSLCDGAREATCRL